MNSAKRSSASSTLASSVYFAESTIELDVVRAWPLMLNYPAWNPAFVGGQVTRIRGRPSSEGELVLIKLRDSSGAWAPSFYAKTIKVTTHRHIVWDVYFADGSAYHSFLDFGLNEIPHGLRFSICCYERNQRHGLSLREHRKEYANSMHSLAAAFERYCKGHA